MREKRDNLKENYKELKSNCALAVSDGVTKEKFEAMREKREKWKENYRELKSNFAPVTTTSPTVVPAPGKSCLEGGPNYFCDCEFTKV